MLGHVARNLADKRMLLVGTYRDVEVDRTHPLSAALAELRRLPAFGRVLLRGLNADEVRRMLSSIAGQEVPWGIAEAVHRQTEGNPLFVQEVVRYLVEEGTITREEGRWRAKSDTPVEMRIPDGLRDVIGKRLSGLSEGCSKVLSVAAVIGRDFRLEALQKVASMSDEDIFQALEEARKMAVVEERTGAGAIVNYRFAHAFFRQTLYEEIIAPRRIRLHQQVARALEEVYKTRLEEHAAELAEHFSHSSDPADLKKAVSYGEMAAQRAMNVYAYGEAARLLEQALKVQEVLDPQDKEKRCDLLLALGDALQLSGQPRQALDVEAPEAFALAEAIGDKQRASRACHLAVWALTHLGPITPSVWTSPEAVKWAERMDRYAAPDTVERIRADVFMGTVRCNKGELREGIALLSRAVDLARRLGDNDTIWWAAYSWLTYAMAPQYAGERLHLVEELVASSRAGLRGISLGGGLTHAAFTFLDWGQRRRAEEVSREYQEVGRTGGAFGLIGLAFFNGFWATIDGRLEEATQTARGMLTRAEEMGLTGFASSFAFMAGCRAWLLLGKAGEALQLVVKMPSPFSPPAQALYLAHLGRDAEAAKILERFVVSRPGIGSVEDETPALNDILYLEAAVVAKHRQAAELLLNRFDSGCSPLLSYVQTCTARHLGGASALLGKYDEARKYYQEAIKVCTEVKFRPEIALTRLQLAELLLEHYPEEKKEALEHLDFAIKEFREMKMQPSLEQALRHKEILKT
jgi:tetratricopeptide (TPR) repeat protein